VILHHLAAHAIKCHLLHNRVREHCSRCPAFCEARFVTEDLEELCATEWGVGVAEASASALRTRRSLEEALVAGSGVLVVSVLDGFQYELESSVTVSVATIIVKQPVWQVVVLDAMEIVGVVGQHGS